jgi:hypothetical protein
VNGKAVALAALIVLSELAAIATHRAEARAFLRSGYHLLWKYAPKPKGMESYQPPDRFAP